MEPEQILMASRAGIHFPTILPLSGNSLDEKAANEWIRNHARSGLDVIAQKIVANINYVSFERFINQLERTIADFNSRVHEPYVLLVAQNPLNIAEGCSDIWVAGLALEYCNLRWPKAILRTHELIDYLDREPELKNILILDDASYSGRHISNELNQLKLNSLAKGGEAKMRNFLQDSHIYIGIPFMTHDAEELLGTAFFTNLHYLEHMTVPMLKEILSAEEARRLLFPLTSKTLTYFDHRFPDNFSTLSFLADGRHLLSGNVIDYMRTEGFITPNDHSEQNSAVRIESLEEWQRLVAERLPASRPLVPLIVSPYKLHNGNKSKHFSKSSAGLVWLGLSSLFFLSSRKYSYQTVAAALFILVVLLLGYSFAQRTITENPSKRP